MATLSGTELVTLIPVKTMRRALRFYTQKVGARLVMRGTGEMKDFWADLRVGPSDVWLITPSKRERRTLAYSAFLVKNIRRFVKSLQQNGVRFERAERRGPETRIEGPIAWEAGGASAFFKDSEGNLLMVFQRPSSS